MDVAHGMFRTKEHNDLWKLSLDSPTAFKLYNVIELEQASPSHDE